MERVNGITRGCIMKSTQLRPISIGIVAENKVRDVDLVKVMPIELFPYVKEEIKDNNTPYFGAGLDADGREYTVQVDIDNTINASWLSLETNRITPPDLIKGEQVLLWQYGDEDKYYYTSMGRDDRLRRLETVVRRYSNISDLEEDVTELTPENSYEVIVSTHDKYIHITTNKYDEEPFAYSIKLDTKTGNLRINDDVGNFLLLDSENTLIRSENQSGAWFELNKEVINGYAPDSINFEAVNTIAFKCTDFTLDASASVKIKTASTTLTCPDSEITGNVKIGGTLDVAAAIKSGASIEAAGSMKAGGDIASGGTVSGVDGLSPP